MTVTHVRDLVRHIAAEQASHEVSVVGYGLDRRSFHVPSDVTST